MKKIQFNSSDKKTLELLLMEVKKDNVGDDVFYLSFQLMLNKFVDNFDDMAYMDVVRRAIELKGAIEDTI